MTPRGSSTISDAVDLELQILATERENITTLLCTKSRRHANVVRKGWRRDFFYDEDSLLITPLHEHDETKEAIIQSMLDIQKALNLSNVDMARELGISERQYYRYVNRENLPADTRIPRIRGALDRLKPNHDANHDVNRDVNQDVLSRDDVVLTNDHDVSVESAQSSPNINKEYKEGGR